MSDKRWELVLPFDTDSPDFARGWEAAQVYLHLDSAAAGFEAYRATVRNENLEMMLRIAVALGWSLEVREWPEPLPPDVDKEWAWVVFMRTLEQEEGEQ